VALGVTNDLTKLLPAIVESIRFEFDFIVDTQSKLQPLADLVNNKTFVAALSFAPGAALVAAAIGGITQGLLEAFVPAAAQDFPLQCQGDFNIVGEELHDAYYALLGTTVDAPFPPTFDSTLLGFRGGTLMYNGNPIDEWSYIVLDVRAIRAKDREFGRATNAPWSDLLDKAENQALNMPAQDKATKDSTFKSCQSIVAQAAVLLQQDLMYLNKDRKGIIATELSDLHYQIYGVRGNVADALNPEVLTSLEIPVYAQASPQQAFDALVQGHQQSVNRAVPVLRELGFLAAA
jgi:hypothetical protein